jgi:Glycosyl hydrolases family 38 N-terminal domain/Glycosyl hydrolases family 38 C-terminal beta sandwich domain
MNDRARRLREQAAGGTFCIVPYCHPDFAWTHHREWHEERYAVSLCEALDLMREHPEFRFCIEPWIDHVQPFLERCPDRVEELRERLASGQMGVKAFTLTSPRPASCADETFLRNMILGRKRYRAFAPQADLSVMACPDVGLGHSQMPQVVKLAGARMYRGWRSDSAFSAKRVPRDFIWRGLDGTETITSRGCYGGLVSDWLIPDDFAEAWEQVVERLFTSELAHSMECSQSHTWWVAQGTDDTRPLRTHPWDQVLPLFDFVRTWNEREQSRMVFATPNEYGARLEAETLPRWEGVIDPVDVAYNSGWHGGRGLWRLRQQLDTAAVMAERACALARLHGADDVAGPGRLEELWTEVVRVASHAEQWVFEKDWEWLLSRARHALREVREEGERAMVRMVGLGRKSSETRPLVLFNPLPYEREELVEVPWVQPRPDEGGHRVWDAEGSEVPVQLGERAGETWGDRIVEAPLLLTARAPALGCAVYRVGDGPVAEAPPAPDRDTLDNGPLVMRFSGRGLQEVRDQAMGLAWTAPRGSAIGDCRLYEMGPGILHIGPITGELSGADGTGRWVLTGPMRWVYRWECEFHGHRVRQDVVADRGAREIAFVTRVFCAGANGFFALCLDLPISGEMHVDIPFGVEPRDLTNEPYAMTMPLSHNNIERHREHQFWARSWASVSDGGKGIALVTLDGDRYWTYDAATGALRHILFTVTHDEDAGWESWVTKERLALGWHEFRHRLVLHDGTWREADLCGVSDRLRLPLQVVKPLGPSAEGFAASQPQLSVTPTTVRLSALCEAEEGYVLRVYESAGEATTTTVELPCAFAGVVKTDFNLEPIEGEVRLNARRLEVPLRAWEVATVVLKPPVSA